MAEYDQTPGGRFAKAFGLAPLPDPMPKARALQANYPDNWKRTPSLDQCLAAVDPPPNGVLDAGTSAELADRLSRANPGWRVVVGPDPERDAAMAALGRDLDQQLVTRPPRGSSVT